MNNVSIYILIIKSETDVPGGHFEYTGARLRLTEAKSETTENEAKYAEIWPFFGKMSF